MGARDIEVGGVVYPLRFECPGLSAETRRAMHAYADKTMIVDSVNTYNSSLFLREGIFCWSLDWVETPDERIRRLEKERPTQKPTTGHSPNTTMAGTNDKNDKKKKAADTKTTLLTAAASLREIIKTEVRTRTDEFLEAEGMKPARVSADSAKDDAIAKQVEIVGAKLGDMNALRSLVEAITGRPVKSTSKEVSSWRPLTALKMVRDHGAGFGPGAVAVFSTRRGRHYNIAGTSLGLNNRKEHFEAPTEAEIDALVDGLPETVVFELASELETAKA